MLSIRADIPADISRRHFNKTIGRLDTSVERLSTGLRINKAADDSSGLMISDSLRSQAHGLGQAIRNANDAISIVQIADAALEESIHIINTIKQKSIQAAQDGQTLGSRKAIQSDITRLLQELDQIANTTTFNGKKLLSGNFMNKSFQIGAYTGEVINLSIGAASSEKIGHTATGSLKMDDEKEGTVSIGIKGQYSNRYQEAKPVEIAYDNNPEHGLGAVADALNALSDRTGVRVETYVVSTTDSMIKAGKTDEQFSLNGVMIGSINVMENDADGSLVKAINLKTTQHGIYASVLNDGRLSLNSTDGRAIKVMPGPDTQNMKRIFGAKELSTFGEIIIRSSGPGIIDIKNMNDGDPVAVKDKGLQVNQRTRTEHSSTLTAGSVLARNSILQSPWTADQKLTGALFQDEIVLEQETVMQKGSVLGTGSVVLTRDQIPSALIVQGIGRTASESTIRQGSLLAQDSILGKGTQLPAGNVVSAGTVFKGDAFIDATADTTAQSKINEGSVLEPGTVLASGSVIQGTAVVNAAGPLNGNAVVHDGSVLRTGSVIGSGTVLQANATVNAIANTVGSYSLAVGSQLTSNTVFSSGTTLGGDAWVAQIAGTTSDYVLADGSFLQTGSVLASGTVLTGNATVNATGAITGGFNVPAGSILRAGTILGSGTILTNTVALALTGPTTGNNYSAAAGSTLAAGSIFGNGTTLNGSATVNAISGGAGESMTLAAGSVLATGTVLGSGQTLNTTGGLLTGPLTTGPGVVTTIGANTFVFTSGSIAAGSSLATGSVAGDPGIPLQIGMVTAGPMTLMADSTIANGTSLTTGSSIGADNAFLGADLLLGNAQAMTTNSALAANSSLVAGTVISPGGVSLAASMTLSTGAMTLRPGSTIALASRLNRTSVIGANDARLIAAMTLANNMTIQSASDIGTGTVMNAGSIIGGSHAQLSANMTLAANMTLTQDSVISNQSILQAGSVVSQDRLTLSSAMSLTGNMTVETGSRMAAGSEIKYGSFIWADATLLSSMTLQDSVMLASDMRLNSDLILGAGSSLGGNSILMKGSSIYLPLELQQSTGLARQLALDAGSKLSNDPATIILQGTRVGGTATLVDDLVIKSDFELAKGSLIAQNSIFRNGSGIGGTVETAQTEIVADSAQMRIKSDSILARGSVLAKGTYLYQDFTGLDGHIYSQGSRLEQDVAIEKTTLSHTMFLEAGSAIEASTVLKMNTNENAADAILGDIKSSRFSDIDVLSQNSAQLAISMADEALADLDKIRADLGSFQNQLTSTIAGISVARVNIYSSAATIREVDFAQEAQILKQMQILSETGRFALSSASSRSSGLISLLQSGTTE